MFAQGREKGIEPQLSDQSKKLAAASTSNWIRRNTEFFYAFQLAKVLARVNKKSFTLEAPAIEGVAPESVVSYLRESTQCWLYGLHGACIALCRACLEEALRYKLPPPSSVSRANRLEDLIDQAVKDRVLDTCLSKMAHDIRKLGNRVLHGEP